MMNIKKISEFNNIEPLYIKEKLPQVGSKIYNYYIKENKIVIDKENEWLDFIINLNGDIIIGKGHYKISNKSDVVTYAGRLKILNGKIVDVDGDSGHYIPKKEQTNKIKNILINIDIGLLS
jgi:hypothetical protein